MQLGIQQAKEKGHQNEEDTEVRIHDDWVVQRATDGYKAVIGHHSQEQKGLLYMSSIHAKRTKKDICVRQPA